MHEDKGRGLSERQGLSPRQFSIAEELGPLDLPRGEGVYLVGGTVRDLLLGRESFDVDLAVEGDAIEFARGLGGEVTAHGRFGTAVVRFPDGRQLDVVTCRRETYAAPAALPDVAAGTIEDDLARRDFTVNAIAASLGSDFGRIRDPHGGRADLEAQVIRVLHPRVVHGRSDPDLPRRALRDAARIPHGSRDRAAGPRRHARRRAAHARSLPRGDRRAALGGGDRAHARAPRRPRRRPRPTRRWCSVSTHCGSSSIPAPRAGGRGWPCWPAEHPGLVERLALRREDERAVEAAVALAPRLAEATDPVEIADLAGKAPEGALLALAEHDSPALRDWFTRLRDVRLEVTGTDLAELGLPESPRVGEILEELRRRKLRGELDGREAELAAARELIAGD